MPEQKAPRYTKMQRLANPAAFDLVTTTAARLAAELCSECSNAYIEIGPVKSELFVSDTGHLFLCCFAEIIDSGGREVVGA